MESWPDITWNRGPTCRGIRNSQFVCDFDGFQFVIPAGYRVVEVEAFYSSMDGNFAGGLWNLFSVGDAALIDYEYLSLSPVTKFTSVSFQTNYTYQLFDGSLGFYGMPVNGFGDWNWTFVVARVPEPGTLALLGLGLAALSFSRRRKSK